MAKRYVLGERAARFLHEGMTSHFGDELSSGKHFTQSLLYPDPWTIRWSSTIRKINGSSPSSPGCWIIWLPDGCMEGCSVNTLWMRPLTPEDDHMPHGWYAFVQTLPILSTGTTPLYARADNGKLLINVLGGKRIADIICDDETGAKNVKQIYKTFLDLTPHPWDITEKTADNGAVFFTNCYYAIGAKVFSYGSSNSVSGCNGKIVAIKVSMDNANTLTIEKYDSISHLQTELRSTGYYICPLYWFGGQMEVKMDFRTMPNLSAWEPA